jgi:hypothetical protein
MSTHELPGGVAVRTFSPAPDGFDPLQATEKELLAYGYPSRPQEPALLERWERVLGGSVQLIQPTFGRLPYQRQRRRQPWRGVDAEAVHGTEFTEIWSGAVVYAPEGDTCGWVEGEWTVPNAFPPKHAASGTWYSVSTWIGLDGIHGGDVLQAGCDSTAMTSAGKVHRQLNPWWEWYPADTVAITNLPVVPGDTLDCLICVDAGSATAATIFMLNVTSGVAASFRATAPEGTALVGDCAEWVVERLKINSSTPQLARYGDVYFAAASAGTVAGAVVNAGAANVITMTDTGDVTGHPLSTGLIETPTLVQVRYTGP